MRSACFAAALDELSVRSVHLGWSSKPVALSFDPREFPEGRNILHHVMWWCPILCLVYCPKVHLLDVLHFSPALNFEDDELSNTMFTVPFWKDGASWFITRMNKERDLLSLSSSIWSLVCNTKGALLVLPGSMWSINIKHLQSSARKPPLRSRILNSALFHNHLLQFSYSGCPYIAIFNPYWFIFRLNN